MNKEVEPFFVPVLSSEEDVQYFDEVFTSEPTAISIDSEQNSENVDSKHGVDNRFFQLRFASRRIKRCLI